MEQQTYETSSPSLIIKERQIKTTVSYYLSHLRIACKISQTGWLSNCSKEFISHNSGCRKSKIRVSAWLNYSEGPFEVADGCFSSGLL